MTSLPPLLAELAARKGVATEFTDWRGMVAVSSESTVRAVLAALGVDASTEESIERALRESEDSFWRPALPPSVVVRQGREYDVPVCAPLWHAVQVEVELEDGSAYGSLRIPDRVETREVDGEIVTRRWVRLPENLPIGYHTLRATIGDGAEERQHVATLIVPPDRLELPPALRNRPLWGLTTQLYSLRSRRSWGIGDFADLADLASWSGREVGASFVLINPLHAAQPIPPMDNSPYLPTTRRFVSPLYLRVEDVPEYAYLDPPAREAAERLAERHRSANGTSDLLDRDAVWADKQAVLELVWALPRTPGRQARFEAYLDQEGQGLVDFATWCALAEKHGLPWQEWPEELRNPGSPAVGEARVALGDRVDFHCWLQWLVDEQKAAAQLAATQAMALGIVEDLAVGVHPDGADAWALGTALARGISVGAPPDPFNQQGQDWSQPPLRPDTLAELGYAPVRRIIGSALRHARGLRVDHVIGMFRLWWIPEGMPPDKGTYVRYDAEAMIGILALEAARAGAVLVGEDLGVVEPGAREHLRQRGILGTSILWFERDWDGRPIPPERWRELCLAAVTTHDLPPTAGYLAGEHIRIRSELGLLTRSVEEEREADASEQGDWIRILEERGLVAPGAPAEEVVVALHRLLAAAPSLLRGLSLADAVGDRRAMNQPGTSDEYPNWRLPLTDGWGRPVLLEDLPGIALVRSLAAALGGRSGHR